MREVGYVVAARVGMDAVTMTAMRMIAEVRGESDVEGRVNLIAR